MAPAPLLLAEGGSCCPQAETVSAASTAHAMFHRIAGKPPCLAPRARLVGSVPVATRRDHIIGRRSRLAKAATATNPGTAASFLGGRLDRSRRAAARCLDPFQDLHRLERRLLREHSGPLAREHQHSSARCPMRPTPPREVSPAEWALPLFGTPPRAPRRTA